MGKKKIAPENNIEVTEVDIPAAPTPEELDMLQVHLADVDLKFGAGKDYNRERIEGEICTYAEQYKKSILETGKRLILLKEHEGHGGFLESLKRLDIDPRTAQNMMSVARKFIDESGNAKALAYLPPTKLYMLASLEDEELDALEEGEGVAGLTIEDAEKLSSRALKKKLQEVRAEKKRLEELHQQEIEIKDQLLEDKNKKIDELDGKLRISTDPSRWNEKAEEYLDRLHRIIPQSSRIMGEMAEIIEGIQAVETKDWEQSQRIVLEQFRFTFDQINDDLDKIDNMLRFAAPEGNSVFHSMNALRPLSTSEEEALDV